MKFKRTNVIVSCEREIRTAKRSLVTVGKQVQQNDKGWGQRWTKWLQGGGQTRKVAASRRDNHSRLESDTDSGLYQMCDFIGVS